MKILVKTLMTFIPETNFKTNIMKKLLYLFLTVLIVACSGEDGGNANNEQLSIIDKWYVIKYEFYEDGILDNIENVKERETNGCRSYFELKTDYTIEFVNYFSDCSGIDGQTFGTWELIDNSNTLRLNYNSETFDWDIITFNENNLTIQIEDCDDIGCYTMISFYER